MTFSETLFMFSRGRRFYEIVGKYYLLKTSTEQIFYSDWNRRRSVKLYSCFPDIEGFMRLRTNTLSAQIDGSEMGVGGTRQAWQIRSICLSNMKIFLKVVNTQQVYLESDIQHLPMPHFWDITSDHITFISLNDGSRESIALLYLLLFYVKCPEPLNTICHRMTGTFWKFQVDFSPCANNDDSLSSSGQHFFLNEFQHKSKRGSCYILNGYFECTMFLNLPIEEVSQVWKAVKELEAGTTLTDFDSLGSSLESSPLLLSLSGAPSSFGTCNFIFFLFEFL